MPIAPFYFMLSDCGFLFYQSSWKALCMFIFKYTCSNAFVYIHCKCEIMHILCICAQLVVIMLNMWLLNWGGGWKWKKDCSVCRIFKHSHYVLIEIYRIYTLKWVNKPSFYSRKRMFFELLLLILMDKSCLFLAN